MSFQFRLNGLVCSGLLMIALGGCSSDKGSPASGQQLNSTRGERGVQSKSEPVKRRAKQGETTGMIPAAPVQLQPVIKAKPKVAVAATPVAAAPKIVVKPSPKIGISAKAVLPTSVGGKGASPTIQVGTVNPRMMRVPIGVPVLPLPEAANKKLKVLGCTPGPVGGSVIDLEVSIDDGIKAKDKGFLEDQKAVSVVVTAVKGQRAQARVTLSCADLTMSKFVVLNANPAN